MWLRDPATPPDDASATTSRLKETGDWNHETYVNFGHGDHRDWEDGVKYSFISAGGDARWRDAISRLEPNDRVWVNVPGYGYAGVGTVEDAAVPVSEFMVTDDKGQRVAIRQAPLKCKDMGWGGHDPEMAEYLVRVKWAKTVPLSQAIHERGLFGNQNCVVRPKDAKWPYTIERLKQHFGIKD